MGLKVKKATYICKKCKKKFHQGEGDLDTIFEMVDHWDDEHGGTIEGGLPEHYEMEIEVGNDDE